MFRRLIFFVLLPIVIMMIVVHTKGKGAVKTIWWYVQWTTFIYFGIGIGRLIWSHYFASP